MQANNNNNIKRAELPESRVLIVGTGGTISMVKTDRGLVPSSGLFQTALKPRPSFNDLSPPESIDIVDSDGKTVQLESLRTPRSQYGRPVRYTVLEFQKLLDSSSIDAKGWTEIALTIQRNYELFDAFVILHGTDSLAYTCSALSFMLQNLGKPVILTGSQASMLELQNDATDNLLGSLIIAGHFMIPEVCLFFNYKLFRGNRTTKVSAEEFSAFASPNFPPLATITSLKTRVSWDLIHRATQIKPFRVQANLDTIHVACLRIFPGIRVAMVEAVLNVDGLRGLVLETFGAGNAPGGPDGLLTKVLADAVRKGIVIVNVTQCMTGSVNPLYESARYLDQVGVISGYDLTSEAALTKLSYLIALPGMTTADVRRLMASNLRGEITLTAQTQFIGDQLAPGKAVLSRLGYAIAEGEMHRVLDILERFEDRPEWLLNEADYTGNTPLHLAATGPNLEILLTLLSKGASVHIRNREGKTPLFLAAQAGLRGHVILLRKSGAHLHPTEIAIARLHAQENSSIWQEAGL